jgi:hypothetical protein
MRTGSCQSCFTELYLLMNKYNYQGATRLLHLLYYLKCFKLL